MSDTTHLLSDRFERAVETARKWPVDCQEAAADLLEQLDSLSSKIHKLTPEERADLEEALAEARRGEFATDARIAAAFERLGQ